MPPKPVDLEREDPAVLSTPDSATSRKRRAVNKNCLLLTKSGRVSGSANTINAKYDAS
jgi:hypothetical protein